MAVYEDFASRQAERFRMFSTAVAGERALASAAGMPAVSLKQWSRAELFRTALLKDLRHDMLAFYEDYLNTAMSVFRERGELRMSELFSFAGNVTKQIIGQSNRQAAFGKANPVDAMQYEAGAIGLLAQRKMADPTFKVRDTANRQWDAGTLMKLHARDFAYQTLIDSQYSKAISEGAVEVIIEHPDPEHPNLGKRLPLLTGDWMLERDKTFHINSNMTVNHATVQA